MNHQNFSEEIFKKKFFKRRFVTLTLFQYFNSSAFLSRKRVQKYCFTAYHPNILNTFLQEKCSFARKSLILKRCRRAYFYTSLERIQAAYTLLLYIKALEFGVKCLHSCHRRLIRCVLTRNGWQQRCHHPAFPATMSRPDFSGSSLI